MNRPPLTVVYISTAVSITTLGDSLLYTILPSYYPHLGLAPLQVGILLSVNRWVRLGTNHLAENCYRRYPSDLWLILALLVGTLVTITYGLVQGFLFFLAARAFWGISYSFLRQAGIMTAVSSGPEIHIGERVGYYRGIDAMWRATGIILGGLSHDLFGFSITFITLGIISLTGMPLGALSQKGLRKLDRSLTKSPQGKGDIRIILCGLIIGIVGHGMIISTLGLILKEQVGESFAFGGYSIGVVTLTGIILGLHWFIDAIGNPVFGAIADRVGRERSVFLCFGIGTFVLFLSGIYLHPILLIFLTLAIFACNAPLYTLLATLAGQSGTRSVASYATAVDLGMSFGPLIGWSLTQASLPSNFIFLSCGAFYLVGTILFYRKFE